MEGYKLKIAYFNTEDKIHEITDRYNITREYLIKNPNILGYQDKLAIHDIFTERLDILKKMKDVKNQQLKEMATQKTVNINNYRLALSHANLF